MFRASLDKVGFPPLRPRSQAEIDQFIATDRARWAGVIKALNISLDYITVLRNGSGKRSPRRRNDGRHAAGQGCRPGVHRAHPHALEIAAGNPAAGPSRRPGCRLEIFEPWVPAIKGVDFYSNLEVLYWLHLSRRDFVLQSPKNNGNTRGTFSLRSPVRPNPIGTSIVKLVGVEGNVVLVRGLDCLDETPLIDLKPDRCEFTPLAPPQAGDFETE